MTFLGIVAFSFLGLAGVGVVLLALSHQGSWDTPHRPRVDRYWMSMAAPILIVGGFAGALLTALVASLIEIF